MFKNTQSYLLHGMRMTRPSRKSTSADIAFPARPPLPATLLEEASIPVDPTVICSLRSAVVSLLRSLPDLGHFPENEERLERFEPTSSDVFTNFATRRSLYLAAASHEPLVTSYEQLMQCIVLPHLVEALTAAGDTAACTTFWYQLPPTVRIQPPNARMHGRTHRDAEYGHQPYLRHGS